MNKQLLFVESKNYEKNIKFFSQNLKKLLNGNNVNLRNKNILDYGCGNCLLHKYLIFKKVFLYDLSHKYYKNNYLKKPLGFQNFQEIKEYKGSFDIILLNSVIQYIRPSHLKKNFKVLLKKLKKNGFIIISDIPEKTRLGEILSFKEMFYNIKVILYFLTKPRYFKYNFFNYKKDYLKGLLYNKKFKFYFKSNLNFSKNRYTLIIKKTN